MNIILIAKVCHEAHKAWCEGINDFSQKHWDDTEKWQQESTLNTVLFILNNPDLPLQAIHEQWIAAKINEGWKYGPSKNNALKTHPDLVPYDQLTEVDKKKDGLFWAIVKALK